uniref:Uncharacterized protein n=1 Tax=Lepeophtheirus salmonis TaxID=72036 RepID=A0A0K2U444_LEPSM
MMMARVKSSSLSGIARLTMELAFEILPFSRSLVFPFVIPNSRKTDKRSVLTFIFFLIYFT